MKQKEQNAAATDSSQEMLEKAFISYMKMYVDGYREGKRETIEKTCEWFTKKFRQYGLPKDHLKEEIEGLTKILNEL